MKTLFFTGLWLLFGFSPALGEDIPSGDTSGLSKVIELNSAAPRLALFDIHGQRFDSAERLGKRYVLYSLFTTYCDPCIREFTGFIRLLDTHPQALEVILIDVGQDSREALKQFQLSHRLDRMTLLRDRFGLIREEFGVDDRVPVTFLVDPSGKIIFIQKGTFPDEKPFEVINPLILSGIDE